MPYVNIRLKISDEMYDIFQNKMRRGVKTFFLDSLMSKIDTDNPNEVHKRIKQIIMGDFEIVFGSNGTLETTQPTPAKETAKAVVSSQSKANKKALDEFTAKAEEF